MDRRLCCRLDLRALYLLAYRLEGHVQARDHEDAEERGGEHAAEHRGADGTLGGGARATGDHQRDQAAEEAARTIPPREHGGNVDIKNLSRGSRVFMPIYVSGAKFSVGDLHFSQGDGEITFCGDSRHGIR